MGTPVGTYARLSYIYEKGDDLGIARQQRDTGTLIKLRGWEAEESYADPDLSAYHPRVTRPEFERMLGDLESGRIKGIVAYDLDRLFRQPSDLERLIKIYDRAPGLVFATVQGDINLSTSDGRTLARVMVAFANKSSADTARRVARKKLEKAMAGDSTSNYRAFGWNDDGTLNDTEAALLRDIVAKVFAGIGLPTIALQWNRQDIKTVRGKEWHSYTLRRILSAPRIAGFAVYKGEILLGDNGKPVKGNWTPLLEENEWRALHDIINPRKGAPAVRRKRYLLSGIARCGLCGMKMVGGTPPGRGHRYMCQSPDSGGCAKVSIDGARLDKQIELLIRKRLANRTILIKDSPGFPAESRLTEIAGKIAELMDQYNQSKLSGSIVFPQVLKLEEEQKDLQAQQGQYTRTQKKAVSIAGDWPDWTLEEKRAAILSEIEAIVIKPSGRTGAYDPERVDLLWVE